MSTLERDGPITLPAPISLTLEEAKQVAGGFIVSAGGLSTSQLARDFIINGIPIEYWNLSKTLPSHL